MTQKPNLTLFTKLFGGLLLLLVLGACGSQVDQPQTQDVKETPLFNDADVEHATLASFEEKVVTLGKSQAPKDLIGRFAAPGKLTATSRSSASGYLVYISRDYSKSWPGVWRIFRINQATGTKTLVYKGKRYIQSVAITRDGNTLVFAMSGTTSEISDYEIFRYTVSSKVLTQLTQTSYDETDVGITASGSTTVWEGEEYFSGKRTVYYLRGGTTYHFYSHGKNDLKQPAVVSFYSSDYLIYVDTPRLKDAEPEYALVWYSLADNQSYRVQTVKAITGTVLEYPSTVGPGWAWLERKGSTAKIKSNSALCLCNLERTVLSGTSSLDRPYLTADGGFFSYVQYSDPIKIYTISWDGKGRSLVATSKPNEQIYAPFWQSDGF